MGEAKALYGKGEFEQSRLMYVEACSIARTDNCVRSLAVAELAAGRPADAYVHFQEVAKGAAAVRLDPRAARELNEFLQEAYGKCGVKRIHDSTRVTPRVERLRAQRQRTAILL